MSIETSTAKTAKEVADRSIKTTEALIKKAWSILDAASEKKAPSEYLSKQAIQSVQGISQSS